MNAFDNIVFVDTERGEPDRGWGCGDVAATLERVQIPFRTVHVRSADELERAAAKLTRSLFWPLNFTFIPDPESARIVQVLSSLSLPYVGCNPRGFSLGSKLKFKEALAASGIEVPRYKVVANPRDLDDIEYPSFIKTEYTCDSQGVRLAHSRADALAAVEDLSVRLRQRVFAEAIAGITEWTLACLVVEGRCLSASLGLKASEAPYIDASTKRDNTLLRISVPSSGEDDQLSRYAAMVIARLGLTGYFRLDVLTRPHKPVLPIDLNLLPHLGAATGNLSYMPMAFMLKTGCSYEEVLAGVIASAINSNARVEPQSRLREFLDRTPLLKSAGAETR